MLEAGHFVDSDALLRAALPSLLNLGCHLFLRPQETSDSPDQPKYFATGYSLHKLNLSRN